jgi:hypothetical protein
MSSNMLYCTLCLSFFKSSFSVFLVYLVLVLLDYALMIYSKFIIKINGGNNQSWVDLVVWLMLNLVGRPWFDPRSRKGTTWYQGWPPNQIKLVVKAWEKIGAAKRVWFCGWVEVLSLVIWVGMYCLTRLNNRMRWDGLVWFADIFLIVFFLYY